MIILCFFFLFICRPAGLVIADMGCGEAELAQNVKNEVYSFDLYAVNEYVTVADISEVIFERVFLFVFAHVVDHLLSLKITSV